MLAENMLSTVVGGGMVGLGAVIALVYKITSGTAPFLYANARIAARSKYLIPDSQLPGLAEAKSINELVNGLQATEYYEKLAKLVSLRDFHAAIEKAFIDSALELKEMSPKKFQELIEAYLMFYEGKMLKTIYRDKYSKVKAIKEPEAQELVQEVGSIDSTLLKHLLETETIADINLVISQTKYAKVFSKEYDSLEEFEIALDNFILDSFVKKLEKLKMHDSKFIAEILNKKFDVINLLTVMKTIIRGLPVEKRARLLVKNKSALSQKYSALIKAQSPEELVALTQGTAYHEVMAKALEEFKKDKSLSHFERLLHQHYKHFIIDAELKHIQGPYPLFSYLTKKEFELKNLLVISRGIEAKFPSKKIMELVV